MPTLAPQPSSPSPPLPVASVARDRLIAAHLEMARRIALRVACRVPTWVCRDDLVACALVGLTEAAGRYDAARDEPFAAFAEKRIRGAVLDELRRGDIMTRRGRREARRARSTANALGQSLGRAPEQAEVAAALGLSVEEYLDDLTELTPCTQVELSPAISQHLAAPDEDACDRILREERTSRVRRALGKLPERDALVLALYYQEELTYAEIASLLSVTESRVCQLHGRARARLAQLVVVADPT